MFDELNDELDKAFWLPTQINELTHSGIQNVAHKMVPLLPPLQQNRIHNVIESALIKEFDTLSDDEIKLFKIGTTTFTDSKFIVLIEFKKSSNKAGNMTVYDRLAFSTLFKAQQALAEYSGMTLESCTRFFDKPFVDHFIDFDTYIYIRIIYLDVKR